MDPDLRGKLALVAGEAALLDPPRQRPDQEPVLSPMHGALPHPLATPEQQALEAQALELFASSAVRAAIARMREVMRASPLAASPAGRATLEQNLHEWAFSACFGVAAMQPARPRVGWTINLPHRGFGRPVPGTRHGVDNPDNVYRVIAVAPGARYALHGRVPAMPAADVSFTVFSAYPGDGQDSRSLAVLTLEQIERDADGRFTLAVGGEARAGARNHLPLPAAAQLVFVRDSLLDWARESPLALAVELLSAPPAAPARPVDARAAAAAVERAVPYWTASMPSWFARHPMNLLPPPATANFAYTKQVNVAAQWQLADDQALMFTLDAQGAAYLGVQLADPWGASPDYAAHSCSLNRTQAVADADGRFTFVLSRHDPGVANWLDPAGLAQGCLMVRWQGLPAAGIVPERSLCGTRVLRVAELPATLPRVDAAGRAQARAARRAAHERRLAPA